MDWINTIPDWAIEALLAFIAGGCAAAVGWILGRLGFRWGQLLGVLVLLLTLGLDLQFGIGWLKTSGWTDEQTEAAVQALAPDVAAALKNNFPDDYAGMR